MRLPGAMSPAAWNTSRHTVRKTTVSIPDQVLHCPYMAADARLVVKEMTRQTERKQELDEYEKAALDEWESGLGPENKTSQFQSLSFGNICKVYLLQ